MKRRETLMVMVAGAALAGFGLPGTARATTGSEKAAPPFSVDDATGKSRTLDELRGNIVVLEWTSPSCPFVCAQYANGKMQELHDWAKEQGVVWLSVLSTNPGRRDYLDPQKARAFNQRLKAQPTVDESVVPKSRN